MIVRTKVAADRSGTAAAYVTVETSPHLRLTPAEARQIAAELIAAAATAETLPLVFQCEQRGCTLDAGHSGPHATGGPHSKTKTRG